MNNSVFIFAEDLPKALQKLANEPIETLETILKNRELPNGERFMRSYVPEIQKMITAIKDERFIGLPNLNPELVERPELSECDQMETSESDREMSSDRQSSEDSFNQENRRMIRENCFSSDSVVSDDTEIIETGNIYVPESDESNVSESESENEMDFDEPSSPTYYTGWRTDSSSASPSPSKYSPESPDSSSSDEYRVTSTYRENAELQEQEIQMFQGPEALYPTIELAISAYYEHWNGRPISERELADIRERSEDQQLRILRRWEARYEEDYNSSDWSADSFYDGSADASMEERLGQRRLEFVVDHANDLLRHYNFDVHIEIDDGVAMPRSLLRNPDEDFYRNEMNADQ